MLVRPAYGAAVLICAFARTLCAEPIAVTPTRFILTAASFIDPSGGLVAGAADAQFTFEGGRFRAAAESRAQTNEAFVPVGRLPGHDHRLRSFFRLLNRQVLAFAGRHRRSAGGLQRQPGRIADEPDYRFEARDALPLQRYIGRVSIAALFRPRIVGGIQRPTHLGRAGNRTTQTFQSSRGADARRVLRRLCPDRYVGFRVSRAWGYRPVTRYFRR